MGYELFVILVVIGCICLFASWLAAQEAPPRLDEEWALHSIELDAALEPDALAPVNGQPMVDLEVFRTELFRDESFCLDVYGPDKKGRYWWRVKGPDGKVACRGAPFSFATPEEAEAHAERVHLARWVE